MPYPDSFYYQEHSASDFILTNEPGEIDMDSLRNRAPKFFKHEGAIQLQKKTLVIKDWTAEQWSDRECDNQIKYYTELLKEGFEIYAWQAPNSVVKLSLKNIEQLKNFSFRVKMTPVKKSHIDELMASKKIPAKQVQCLPMGEPCLSNVANSRHNAANLIQYIIHEHGILHHNKAYGVLFFDPQPEELHFTYDAYYQTMQIDLYTEDNNKKITSTPLLPKAELKLISFLESHGFTISPIQGLSPDILATLKSLSLINFQPENTILLSDIFAKTTDNLNKLTLSEGIMSQLDVITLPSTMLGALKELTVNLRIEKINKDNPKIESFLKILSQTPQLETLTFQCNNHFIMTLTRFLSILKNAKNIKSFNYVHFADDDLPPENIDSELSKIKIEKLEHFSARRSCHPDLLAIILDKAINLQSLHLSFIAGSSPLKDFCHNENTHENLSKRVSKLKTLKIDSITNHFYAAETIILLKKINNLKSLTLDFGFHPTENPFLMLTLLPNCTLNTLESLILSGPVQKKALKQFLEKAQNLKILDLSKCPNIQHLNLSKSPHLKDLIVLYPQNRDIEKPAPSNSQSKKSSESGASGKTVDADTTYKDTTFNVTTMFWGMDGMQTPSPNDYRIQVKNSFYLQEDRNNPFKLKNSEKLILIEPKHKLVFHKNDTYKLKKPLHYYAKKNITLTNEWQALPSLSAQESITDIHVNGINNEAVDIQYSQRDSLYYIKNKTENAEPTPITLDFRLTAPDLLDRSGTKCSANILKLVKKYQAYTTGPLKISPDATSAELLEALQSQSVGACRHRTIAFMAEIQALYPEVEVRIVNNECHSFIEVREQKNGSWICCDLGGYPGELKIDNKNKPTEFFLPESFLQKLKKIIGYFWNLAKSLYKKITGIDIKNTTTAAPAPENPSTIPSAVVNPNIAPETPKIDIETSDFNTWKKTEVQENSITAYLQQILNGKYGHKKTLVDFKSEKMIDDFGLLLKKQCIDTPRPVYYVNSAADLKCAIDWIERIPGTNEGLSREGPGGPLYEFLKKYEHNSSVEAPVIIINWDNFDADEVIQNNGLISDPRMLEGGLKLPKPFHIIGLRAPERLGAYTKEDFDSRFEETTLCPFSQEALQAKAQPLTSITTVKTEAHAQSVIIDLYESSDWKSLLLGQWSLDSDKFVFINGALEAALKKAKKHNLPLEIKNGPWQNKHFAQFWQQAKLDKIIDENIPIVTSQGYDWDGITKEVKFSFNGIPKQESYLLNPGTFGKYFSETVFKKENSDAFETEDLQLYRQAGWLEQNKEKFLSLYLTQALSTHQWARLFDFAQKQKVLLQIHVAPGVKLPEGLPKHVEETPISSKHPRVFISKDIDYAVDQLKKEHDHKSEIFDLDISECEASDLLVFIKPHWNKTPNGSASCHFSQKANVLLTALEKGDTVILKGKFKPALINALASLCMPKPYLWVNGEKKQYKGTCLFVSDEQRAPHFSFAHTESVLVPAKYDAENTFVRVQTEKEYLKDYPDNNPEDNWQGLEHIEHTLLSNLNTKIDLSLEASQKFETERFAKFEKALQRPHMVITGKTGVGKTAFIKELAKNTDQYKVHYGKSAYAAWAQDNTNPRQTKILFIDEANIEGGDFSAFESLYNKPPGLLINGTYYKLSPQHKVIFACNPKSYGNRGMPSFFARRGGAIKFDPLNEAYLHHKVLKPVFKGTPLTDEEQEKISIDILKIYRYITSLPGENILISPRELQMMAVLISMQPKYKTYYIKSIAEMCIPSEDKAKFNQWYSQEYGAVSLPSYKKEFASANQFKIKFVLTESRVEAYQKVMDFLELRKFKQSTSNAIARYAGLGGMIFEGEPGIGKSQFVIDVLRANNFEEAKLFDPKKHAGKFYITSASMSISKKEKIRFEAFNTGSLLIEDEINGGPMKEDSSNAFLMGHDLENNPPQMPGFVRVVTQNPISMDGRLATSTASERRNMKVELPQYINSEMEQILIQKGLHPQRAFELVQEYTTVREYGIKHHKKPLPTFRKLKQKAKAIIKAQQKHAENSIPEVTLHSTTVDKNPIFFKKVMQKTQEKYPDAIVSENRTQITLNIIPNKTAYQISSQAQGTSAGYASIIKNKATSKQKAALLQKICSDAVANAPKDQVFIIAKQNSIAQENKIAQQLQIAISKINNQEKRLTIVREGGSAYPNIASNSGKIVKRSPTRP